MGFYVVGRLMAVEDVHLPSGVRKRLSVYYGDSKLLLVYADSGVELPPVDTITTFAVSRLNVDKRGNLTAILQVNSQSEDGGAKR